MTTLFLVRHAITEENLNYTLIGRTDPPLHAYGVMQAGAVAHALSALQLDAVVSSPLVRCFETARRIADRQGLHEVRTHDALTEIDLGVVDGMSSFTAYETYRAVMDEALDEALPDFRFPQGESRREALRRFDSAVACLVHQYPQGNVCVVTHGGPLGLWLAHLHNEIPGRFRHWQPAHASITSVICENGRYQMFTHSDKRHLPSELEQRIEQARRQAP